jgi:hypothetical protein
VKSLKAHSKKNIFPFFSIKNLEYHVISLLLHKVPFRSNIVPYLLPRWIFDYQEYQPFSLVKYKGLNKHLQTFTKTHENSVYLLPVDYLLNMRYTILLNKKQAKMLLESLSTILHGYAITISVEDFERIFDKPKGK